VTSTPEHPDDWTADDFVPTDELAHRQGVRPIQSVDEFAASRRPVRVRRGVRGLPRRPVRLPARRPRVSLVNGVRPTRPGAAPRVALGAAPGAPRARARRSSTPTSRPHSCVAATPDSLARTGRLARRASAPTRAGARSRRASRGHRGSNRQSARAESGPEPGRPRTRSPAAPPPSTRRPARRPPPGQVAAEGADVPVGERPGEHRDVEIVVEGGRGR